LIQSPTVLKQLQSGARDQAFGRSVGYHHWRRALSGGDAITDISDILSQIDSGDPSAADQLLPLVYNELRKLAGAKLAQEKPGQTLQPTALVHEAYLRLVGDKPTAWDSRGHFFAAAAEAMRRILIERARQKRGPKRGGQRRRVNLEDVSASTEQPADDLMALDEALVALSAVAPRKGELVKLRFYAGLTIPEAAAALGISEATAQRDWTYARTWLYCRLADEPPSEPSAGNPPDQNPPRRGPITQNPSAP